MLRRSTGPTSPLGQANYFARWSELHSNIDPASTRFLAPWLRSMYSLGRPLVARGVSPHTVTSVGVALAVSAIAASAAGSRWPLLAGFIILLSAVADGVDGAVAVIGQSESRWGYVLDTVADRCSELCFLGCAYVLGAPPAFVVAIAALTLVQESARARAAAAGLDEIGILTVWERPSRVIVALVVTIGCGLAPGATVLVTLMSSLVGVGLALIGFVQLMVVLRRRLR